MRKSWKSTLSIALVATMLLTLSACGSNTSNDSQTTSSQVTTGESGAQTAETGSSADSGTSAAAEPVGESLSFRLGHTQPTEHQINRSAEQFAALVEEKTGGTIHIDIYPSETLGTNSELSEACSKGDVDFYISATGQYTSRYNPFSIVEAFYMFRDRDHLFAFYASPEHDQLVEGLAEACNVHVLADLYYGGRQMTTSGKALNSAEDIVGLKMRAANEPLPIAAFETLGAAPTPIAYNETYLALQQHTVDGQENPPSAIQTMKFYEVQDYLNLTYHQFQMLSIFMSDKAMQQCSPEQIEILYECAAEVAASHNEEAVNAEQAIIDELSNSIEVITPDIDSFREKIAPMYDQFKDQWIDGMYEAIQNM